MVIILQNVVVFVNGGEEGNVYYEQYNTVCSGVVKTGDYVYVATESGKQSIAQINSIWETKELVKYMTFKIEFIIFLLPFL